MVDKEESRSVVTNYLRNNGYLTSGFMGDGPVRIEFVKQAKHDQSVIVGVRESNGGQSPSHEVVAVEVDEENKSGADFVTAAEHAAAVAANRCFIAMPTHFDNDDKEIAGQFGIGLLEIEGNRVNEIAPAKLMKSRLIALPKPRFDGLKLAQELLRFSETDWEHLTRVFCKAEDAWFGFLVGDVFVEIEKDDGTLGVNIMAGAGPLKKSGFYSFKFGELAGFVVEDDDRYTFVDKLGNLFVFRSSDWRFLLRVLAKAEMCHLHFRIGTARIIFSKHPGQEGVDLEMDFNDGRDSCYEYHYSQDNLAKLTKKKKRKIIENCAGATP